VSLIWNEERYAENRTLLKLLRWAAGLRAVGIISLLSTMESDQDSKQRGTEAVDRASSWMYAFAILHQSWSHRRRHGRGYRRSYTGYNADFNRCRQDVEILSIHTARP